MDVRLVIMRKRKRVWTAQLRHKEATLGRARGCTVRIPSSQVSRQHCRLRMENGLVTVEDLESVNGTFVNGKRIREPEIVYPGDRLTIGPVTFVVEYELSTTTLQPLEDEACQVLEAEADVEVIEEAAPQPKKEAPQLTEAYLEVAEETSPPASATPPTSGPLQAVDETDVETVPLAEQEEIHLSDNSTLRDFLIELDEADKRPRE